MRLVALARAAFIDAIGKGIGAPVDEFRFGAVYYGVQAQSEED